MPKVDILGVSIDVVSQDDLQRAIEDCVSLGKREVFAYVNVHAINIAQKDKRFRDFLNGCTLTYCDGEGVRLGGRLLGHRFPSRIALTHFVWDLCESFEQKEIGVFLLGGLQERVERAVATLMARYPRLKIKGLHHGYFDKRGAENDEVVNVIRRNGPAVLFVGFGMPDQEHWIEDNLSHLNTNVVLPCGGMIDYLAGAMTVAPNWMSRNGLEWLHRLWEEPRRLWHRYLIGNPCFVLRIVGERLGVRRGVHGE